jgi:hypothetical protein
VRVDGNIDVNAIRNSQGAYLGNGGKVFVDSAYLFQNGNIFANGVNGGLVQVNVVGMTLGAGAQIQAKGSTGAGGTVAINSAGPVDLRRGSVIDTSGKVLGSLASNLINVEGNLVNNEGTLRADGVNSRGGSIRLVASGQSPYQQIKDSLQAATINPVGDTSAPTLSTSERTFLLQRTKGLIDSREGQVYLSRDTSSSNPAYISHLSANGTGNSPDPNNDYSQSPAPRAGDGGNITVLAMQGIQNLGTLKANGASGRSGSSPANGGNGGTVTLLSQASIANTHGRLEVNGGNGGASTSITTAGNGGDGGLMAFGYNGTMTNTGGIYADGALGGNGTHPGRGGNGGLVVFSGNNNPTGNGSIDVIGRPGGNNNLTLGGKSGTIVSPNPGVLGQTQVYFQQGYVNGQLVRTRATQQTQPVELLTHAENLVMLTKNGGNISVANNLFDRMLQARIRSVEDPTGALGQARTEVINKNTGSSAYVFRNLLLGSSRDDLTLSLSHPRSFGPELVLPSPLSKDLAFTTLNTLTISNNGPLQTLVFSGPNADSPSTPLDIWLVGRNSNSLGGGRISALAKGDLDNFNTFGTKGIASGGSVNLSSTDNISNVSIGLLTEGQTHGGSIILKAGQTIYQNSLLGGDAYFEHAPITSNGGLMGGTIRLEAKQDFHLISTLVSSPISANGSLQGGIITINANGNSTLYGRDTIPITANGLSSTMGRGGFIKIHADNIVFNQGVIEANGGQYGGTVSLTAGDRIPGNEKLSDLLEFEPSEAFSVRGLTPPNTLVYRIAKTRLGETVYNRGVLNALGGSNGQNGKIYLGGNQQVVFGVNIGGESPDAIGGILNGTPVRYFDIVNSASPEQTFQSILGGVQNNGGHVYIVSGQALTNKAGKTRTAVEVVNAEAAPNHEEPNVNPLQNQQGSELPTDFRLAP